MHGQPKSHMGLSLAARSSRENGPRHCGVMRAPGALVARSPPRATARTTRRPALHDRPKIHMGLGLAGWSSGENGPRHGGVVLTPGALTVQSPHTVRVRDGVMARSPAARWWLAGGKVKSGSTSGAPGWRRAMGGPVGLTEEVGHRWGCSSTKERGYFRAASLQIREGDGEVSEESKWAEN
jgi:hypothetical protein